MICRNSGSEYIKDFVGDMRDYKDYIISARHRSKKHEKTKKIRQIQTDYKKIEKGSNEYEQYEAKARLNLINKIYQSHDSNLNEKYKVELNQRTIDRVKNSF